MSVDIGQLSAAAISAERCWPDAAQAPSGPLSLASAPIADQPDRLARRIGRYGLIGSGESYMAGEFSTDDLATVLTEFASSVDDLIPRSLHRLRPIAVARQPRSQFNSGERARQNIAEHYDLSNELFGEFLDETLTYSGALFDTLPATPAHLADAQRQKIDRLLDSARVGPGSRVPEIGTGSGELSLPATARGARVSAVLGPTPTILWPVFIAGVAFWGIGVFFEAVANYQLRRFKSDPANERVLMDRGRWAWTRHPNYFGDACVWWGLWLAFIAGWISLLTVLSPVLMTYFLTHATGARLLEKHMETRPGFREYCSRTSPFIPKPPRLRIS